MAIYNFLALQEVRPSYRMRSQQHMSRPLPIFLSSLVIFGMIQMDCQVLAQSPKEITNSIGMKLVLIPKGTFMMGSPVEVRIADATEHEVTISKDYYLGVTEVTQGQYKQVMGTNPSHNQKRDIRMSDSSMYPVERVSWEDAVAFCKKLSELPEEKKAGRVYRLPTEAEWEYACRAGSKTAYSFGDSGRDLGNYAWFVNNSGSRELDSDALWARLQDNPDYKTIQEYEDTIKSAGCATHPVGEKKANAWGLYDMHGNVWEWCSDWYGEYPKGAVSDPAGPREGSFRVYRGGCWRNRAAQCRSANRYSNGRVAPHEFCGFRVAMSSSGIPK
jgi:formylglycine-generating enzyme required for sulfatase activity